MDKKSIESDLSILISDIVKSVEAEFPNEAGVSISLMSGAKIYSRYWRLVESSMTSFSTFDHLQKYGLSKPVDVVTDLSKAINNLKLSALLFSSKTGDIEIVFENDTTLQIFNFSGHEVWEVIFSDSSSLYSNHLK